MGELVAYEAWHWNVVWVLLAMAIMGSAAAVLGCFSVWMRLGLSADVAAHGTLPGLLLVVALLGGAAPSPLWVLLGGMVGASLTLWFLHWMRRSNSGDAAMAVALSLSFGAGLGTLSWMQQLPGTMLPGLGQLFFGFAAGMPLSEALWLIGVSVVVLVWTVLLAPRLASVIHNSQAAQLLGEGAWLRLVFFALLLALIAMGVRAAGVVMVVGLVLFPAATARCWHWHWRAQLRWAALIGAIVPAVAVLLSAAVPAVPTGASAVCLHALLLTLSLTYCWGTARSAHGTDARRRNDNVERLA